MTIRNETQLYRFMDEILINEKCLIAIDGRCGSGKTTLANLLSKHYDCNVFHMDDFFLQPHQRTTKRYAQPGGNVDYERFKTEVLDHIQDAEGVFYRRFNCSKMELEEGILVPHKNMNVVEGSYSCHPYFGENTYDFRIFVDVSPTLQEKRIKMRAGEEKWIRFKEEWIPLENKYFDTYHIREKSIVLKMENSSLL